MKDYPQHILGAADSACQGLELARSLLQESVGNMEEILTQGCEKLGPASLGSAMRMGRKLTNISFFLDDLLKEAHGLCVLLGHNLGIKDMFASPCDDPTPREDEYDGDEQPS